MNRFVFLLIAVFLVLAGVIWLLQRSRPEFDFTLLAVGNALLAALTAASFAMVRRGIGGRPQAFVGGVYAGTMLKLFVGGGALLAYVLLNRPQLHKPSLLAVGALYLVYTLVEKIALQRVARKPQV